MFELYEPKSMFLCFPGSSAETKFRNLRKRYTNAKKRFSAKSKSGTSAQAVGKHKVALEKFSFMVWLDPYIAHRSTKTNIPEGEDSDAITDESDEEFDMDDEEEGDEEGEVQEYAEEEEREMEEESQIDLSITASATASQTSATTATSAKKVALNKGSIQQREQPKQKRAKLQKSAKVKHWEATRSVEKEELSLIRSLTNKIDTKEDTVSKTKNNGDRDECGIFGELVASKMRKLDEQSREEAMMAINQILSEHRLRHLRKPSAPISPQPSWQPRNQAAAPNQYFHYGHSAFTSTSQPSHASSASPSINYSYYEDINQGENSQS